MGSCLTESATQKTVAEHAAAQGMTFLSEEPSPLGHRPWLTCFAPFGPTWSRVFLSALDEGRLTREEVEADIRRGLVRPSLSYQIKKRAEDPFRLPAEVMRLDEGFLPPELKVSPDQREFLRQNNRRLLAVWWIKKFRGRLSSVLSVPVKRLRQLRAIRHAFKFVESHTFQWGYAFSSARKRFSKASAARRALPEYDWVFILKRKTSERLIEDACDRISSGVSGKHCVYFAANAVTLPRAKVYCFPDASFFAKCLRKIPSLWDAKTLVFYDPDLPDGASERRDVLHALARASRVEAGILQAIQKDAGRNALGDLLAQTHP